MVKARDRKKVLAYKENLSATTNISFTRSEWPWRQLVWAAFTRVVWGGDLYPPHVAFAQIARCWVTPHPRMLCGSLHQCLLLNAKCITPQFTRTPPWRPHGFFLYVYPVSPRVRLSKVALPPVMPEVRVNKSLYFHFRSSWTLQIITGDGFVTRVVIHQHLIFQHLVVRK